MAAELAVIRQPGRGFAQTCAPLWRYALPGADTRLDRHLCLQPVAHDLGNRARPMGALGDEPAVVTQCRGGQPGRRASARLQQRRAQADKVIDMAKCSGTAVQLHADLGAVMSPGAPEQVQQSLVEQVEKIADSVFVAPFQRQLPFAVMTWQHAVGAA
ncbi:hypothetical protein D3C76_959760 [compost metagenome]